MSEINSNNMESVESVEELVYKLLRPCPQVLSNKNICEYYPRICDRINNAGLSYLKLNKIFSEGLKERASEINIKDFTNNDKDFTVNDKTLLSWINL